MGFFVVGVNHKDCPVEIREKLHFGPKKVDEALAAFRPGAEISELVIVSTCNRVEFYGYGEGSGVPRDAVCRILENAHGLKADSFSPYFYVLENKEAIRHLFRVAAGLDSLVVGENEILGQLREAFRAANGARTVHSFLYRLMEKTLKIGKDVRAQTRINEGAVSIPAVAVELAEKIFGRLSGQKILVLGAGEMSELTLKTLRQAGAEVLAVVSRNAERGESLAFEYATQWVSYDDWEKCLGKADILITSTASPHPIVRYEAIRRVMHTRRQRPLFLIDIAVPRDVEQEVNSLDDVYLYNIDDLKTVSDANLSLRRREVEAARELVDKAVLDYQGWLESLKARPTLERFERFLDAVIDKELAGLGEETGDAKRQEIRQRIRAKLMHPALEKIKEASLNGGVSRYLEALHSLFGLDQDDKKP